MLWQLCIVSFNLKCLCLLDVLLFQSLLKFEVLVKLMLHGSHSLVEIIVTVFVCENLFFFQGLVVFLFIIFMNIVLW